MLATVGSTSKSELEFWDLDFNSDDTVKKEVPKEDSSIQQLGVADHYGVTDVEWDPSGRYLATAASAWTHTVCPDQVTKPWSPPKLKHHASSVLTVGSPSTDRERLRNLGFPWTGDREAATGSVQTVSVAAAAAVAAAKGAEAEHPEEPAGVLTCV